MYKKRKIKWIRILFPIPFVIGVIGYRMAGYGFSDSLYGSFCYYFVSVYYNLASNYLMEIARWTAPLMTVTGVLYSARLLFKRAGNNITEFKRNSTVIYCDESTSGAARALCDNLENCFIEKVNPSDPVIIHRNAKNQILFLKDDTANLNFHGRFKDDMEKSQIYIKLELFDSELFASTNVHYIQLTELIAFMFWNKYPILSLDKKDDHEYHIAIIGSNELAQRILIHGLHDNLFFKDQKFIYHIYGESHSLYKDLYSTIALMNGDRVVYEDKEWFESYEEISHMDRVILTEHDNSLTLEKLIYKCGNVPIYYFAQYEANPAQYFRATNIHPFGEMSKVLTKNNILNSKLFEASKDIHFLYVNKNPNLSAAEKEKLKNAEWQKLDGFMQSSYNALASFYYNYIKMYKLGHPLETDLQTLAELEHLRWSRFYFKSFWTYGIPEDGSPRDPEKKIHRALVPYNQLCEEDKDRELKRIQFLIDAYRTNNK
ncbi:MAG: hypothetical protein KBS68_07790 [Clostridiales bacterium]|nr:hypothetical protein [Candidatus Crickella merdequi]